jgi:hypothetical protein
VGFFFLILRFCVRMPDAVADLIRRRVAVIFAAGGPDPALHFSSPRNLNSLPN